MRMNTFLQVYYLYVFFLPYSFLLDVLLCYLFQFKEMRTFPQIYGISFGLGYNHFGHKEI